MPTLKGQTSVAHHNLRSIVHAVRGAESLSRREVARRTGLSTPTVTRHVIELVSAGVLRSGSPEHAENHGPGRPAEELELEPGYGRVLGVDVGEHTIRAAVADFAGRVVAESDRPTLGRKGGDASITQLVDAIDEVLAKANAVSPTVKGTTENPERAGREIRGRVASPTHDVLHNEDSRVDRGLLAVVIGVPGMVDSRRGVVLDAPNLQGWRELALATELRDRIGLEGAVRIENDVNLAAVGEAAHGAANGSRNFVFVSIRRGIGAGIFVDGGLLRGHAGMAGELGFMASEATFDYRSVDGLGHLETTAGEQNLLERAAAASPSRWSETRDDASIRDLCLAVRDGDASAAAIMDEAFQRYGVAVANIVSLLDPELVVVGGDITVIGATAVARIREVVHRMVPHAPDLRCSALGEHAALDGALHQAQLHACDALPRVIPPGSGR